jgi:hypothetical protein
MANFTNKNLDNPTYSLIINSTNRVSGTNNNATFDIHWDDFLPKEYNMYKVAFNFQAVGGNYKDGTYSTVPIVFSSASIKVNLNGRSYSFDTSTSAPSQTLGIIQRDLQTSTSASNTLSCYYLFNAPRTISKPSQTLTTFQIFNQSTNALLVDTNSAGTALSADMTNWTMLLEFIPIKNND